MAMFKLIPTYINKNLNPVQAIYLGIILNIFCYSIMFFRALLGSAKQDWGYSEFLLNYSEGFIRRGLTGTVLIKIYEIFGLDPYLFLTVFLSVVLILILIVYYYLLKSTKVKSSTIIFLSANPLLLNAPFLSVTMFRKDWLIILGLMLHAYYARLILLGKTSTTRYIAFLVFLVFYSQVVILTHEITVLFVFIHYILLKNVIHYFSFSEVSLIRKIYLLFIFLQVSTFIYLSMNSGSPKQASEIAKSISSRVELPNINAILSFGNSPSSVIYYGESIMYFVKNLIIYSVWFYIGPYLIYKVLRVSNIRTLFVYFFLISPLLTLFFINGGDWGRWIVLLSFTLYILLISNREIVDVSLNKRLKLMKLFDLFPRNKSFFVVIFFFCVSLLFRVPVGNPSSIADIWSGIFDILLRYSPI
jgi:hypothetical protein